MQRATIGMIAFYKQEPTLFDNFTLPAGIEKADLIDRMLLEIGEMETIYTNPLILKDAFGFWSRTRVKVWQKLYDIITYDYNPIWNVDGETWHQGNTESHGTQSGSSERDYTRSRTTQDVFAGHVESASDTTNYISADNSSGWSNDTKTDFNGEEATNNTDNVTEGITDNDDISTSGQDDRTGIDNWYEKRQGNIGVTMTQQLLEKEQELWENFDMYGYIIEEVKQEFCVMLW